MLYLKFNLNSITFDRVMSKYCRVRFLRHRPSSRYCCYGNHAAGSKPI